MAVIPALMGISALRLRQNEVLQKLKEGPLVLTQRSQPVAVLVDPKQWNELMERLEELEDALEVAEARLSNEPTISLKEYLASRGEHV